MSALFSTLWPFVIVLFPIVVIHELGHFLVARFVGIRVLVFSVGFGPEILGFHDKKGTRWRLSLIPLGGYVRMSGEDAQSATKHVSKEDYAAQPPLNRIAVAAAGPAANYLLSFVVLVGLFWAKGVPKADPVIGAIEQRSLAHRVGLKSGDMIKKVESREIAFADDFIDAIRKVKNRSSDDEHSISINLLIEREGNLQSFNVPIMPLLKAGRLGVSLGGSQHRVFVGVLGTIKAAFMTCCVFTKRLFQMIFSPSSWKDVGGVLMTAKMSRDVASMGMQALLELAILLSINLGFINLLPIPGLDGGHILISAIAGLSGREPSGKIIDWIYYAGFSLILMIFVLSTYNDVKRLQWFSWLQGIFG